MSGVANPKKQRPLRGGPVCWYGGKGNFLGRLKPLVPHAMIYCEPFGGAASLLFAREPDPIEVYNDLDGRLINLFRAIQDAARFRRLRRRLHWTLYSRAEFELALEVMRLDERGLADPDDLAWATFIAFNWAHASNPRSPGNWARSVTVKAGQSQKVSAFRGKLLRLRRYRDRLARVLIEQRPALEVMDYWDRPEAVFYVDPPYVAATRARTCEHHRYRHELSEDEHRELVHVLLGLEAAVVVSGYNHEIYGPLDEAGWQRREFETFAFAALTGGRQGRPRKRPKRTEVVWRNARAMELA